MLKSFNPSNKFFQIQKIAASIVLEDMEFKQLLWSIFIFFKDPLSSYMPFRTVVPCICAKGSWTCELATLSEQLVYPEDVHNQLNYEKIKNCFAQMMLQLLVEYLLDYDNLDLYNLIIMHTSQH